MTDETLQDFFTVARREIPVELSPGSIVQVQEGTAFWIENIRGYSQGFTFATRLLVSEALRDELALEIGPQMSGFYDSDSDPAATFINTWVGTRSQLRNSSDYTLDCIAANGTLCLVSAEWWVAEPATDNLVIGFNWDAATLQGQVEFNTDDWPTRRANIVTL